MTDTDKLLELAKAATQGDWESWQSTPNAPYCITVGDFVHVDDLSKEDAAYLESAQPKNIIALITELAALRANIIPDDGGEPFTVTVWQALDQLKDMQNFMKEVDLKHAAELAALKAQVDGAFNEGVEAAANHTDPKHSEPCDCIEELPSGFFFHRCHCGNDGDLSEADSWCVCKNEAKSIRTLTRPTKPTEAKDGSK